MNGFTRGAAETVLKGLIALPKERRDKPCMICDGDIFFTSDIVSLYRPFSNTINAIFTFLDTQLDPIYSYVTINDNNNDNRHKKYNKDNKDNKNNENNIQDIKEKIKISDYASAGCYCFKNGLELQKYCEIVIYNYSKILSQDYRPFKLSTHSFKT